MVAQRMPNVAHWQHEGYQTLSAHEPHNMGHPYGHIDTQFAVELVNTPLLDANADSRGKKWTTPTMVEEHRGALW